ncbi:MAG: hypothetical protein RLY30_945 [Pseudomonadota bacterium]|jgi:lipopolysaccharide biosynthesis regulator YciM
MTFDPLWLLALPMLFGLGWFAARVDRQQSARRSDELLDPLSRAVEALLVRDWARAEASLLEVLRQQPDALSLHASVGVVLRLRGEPDRAIEVHQSLLARPQLSEEARAQYTLALADDFRAAGILDRTETLLKSLTQGSEAAGAHERLIELMQRQRRWAEALQSAEWLAHRRPADSALNLRRFHFHMELGQRAAAQALLPEHPRLHDEASSAAPHQCQQCGARLSRHAWQCPACESWDSLRSIA